MTDLTPFTAPIAAVLGGLPKPAGYEVQPVPKDEPDETDLVPEMLERLLAGESIPLQYELRDKPQRYRLTDYIQSACDTNDALIQALAAFTVDRENKVSHFNAVRSAIHNALREECEKDAQFYAAALRAGH